MDDSRARGDSSAANWSQDVALASSPILGPGAERPRGSLGGVRIAIGEEENVDHQLGGDHGELNAKAEVVFENHGRVLTMATKRQLGGERVSS